MKTKSMGLLLAAALAGSAAQGYAADPVIPSGGPKALGQNAQGTEPSGLRAAPASKLPKMPGSEKLVADPAPAEASGPMAEQLKKLPKFADELGSKSGGGTKGGGQTGEIVARTAKVAAGPGVVRMLLKLREDGTSEVLSVQNLPGKAPKKPDGVRGAFVVEVARGETTLAVETMEDPFELRGLADPKNPGEGHSISRAAEAIVTVDVPDGNAEGVSVRLLRFKPGKPIPARLDVQKFRSLQPNLDTVVRLPADKLGPMLKERIAVQAGPGAGPHIRK